MHCKARSWDRIDRLSVRPSVCPSVTLVDCEHIGWSSSKVISQLVSLGCSLSAHPNIRSLLQGEHPEILAQSDTPPLLIWAAEIFDRKLRPNGYNNSAMVTIESQGRSDGGHIYPPPKKNQSQGPSRPWPQWGPATTATVSPPQWQNVDNTLHTAALLLPRDAL